MMHKGVPGWGSHERYIQEALGLDSTIASGAKFHDIGDAVDKRHHSESDFRFIADCKFTESRSYSISRQTLDQWTKSAQELGKRFLLPLRFWSKGESQPTDYVLMGLDDFLEMYETAKSKTDLEPSADPIGLQREVEFVEDLVAYTEKLSAGDKLMLIELAKKLRNLQ